MSGNFLSCSKGVKDPLEGPEFMCDLPGDASVEMGLLSPFLLRALILRCHGNAEKSFLTK